MFLFLEKNHFLERFFFLFIWYPSSCLHSLVSQFSQACWHTPAVPELRRLSQEAHQEFKASLDYTLSSSPNYTGRLAAKNQKPKQNKPFSLSSYNISGGETVQSWEMATLGLEPRTFTRSYNSIPFKLLFSNSVSPSHCTVQAGLQFATLLLQLPAVVLGVHRHTWLQSFFGRVSEIELRTSPWPGRHCTTELYPQPSKAF